jgi:hypothetical protein
LHFLPAESTTHSLINGKKHAVTQYFQSKTLLVFIQQRIY